MLGEFVICNGDSGFILRDDSHERFMSHFPAHSIGQARRRYDDDNKIVYVLGQKAEYVLQNNSIDAINVFETGDGHDRKICNLCFVLKPLSAFDRNQNNTRGAVTRPSCSQCRLSIDRRAMTQAERQRANKEKPPDGSLFTCPICRKESIVGVTAKIVLDHRHSTGTARAFLCDSCNTGLGRFKNGQNYLRNALAYLAAFENPNK